MNYSIKNLITLALILSFVVSPMVSFADSDNGKGKNKAEKQIEKMEKRIEKQIEKTEKKNQKFQEKLQKKLNKNNGLCWDSFFMRVLPFSWLNNNLDNLNLDDDCPFPTKATTTDTVAPIISNISTKTGQRRALVLWNTNERTTGKIYYSTSTPVNTSNSLVVSVNRQGLGGKEHYALLNNLIPGTTYYALIESKDKAGNTGTSSQFSFVTKVGTTTDTTAPVISSINTTIGTSTVRVAWNTNEPATSKVYYGTTTPLVLTSANFVQSGLASTTHNLLIENLATSTTYYMVVESVDSSTNTATSSQFALTTSS